MGDGIPMDSVRNLSLKKTIFLYMAVSLLCSFLFSALIIWIACETQEQIWWKYVDEDNYFKISKMVETSNYMVNVPRPNAAVMTNMDKTISEICDFIQTYIILLLSIINTYIVVLLFYEHKLKKPILELEQASQNIAQNNLDFSISYENKDEMGRLCREFERMRKQLADNNQTLWKNIEEEKSLRAAIAHDIRSPLTVLKGYQEMLIDYLPDKTININKAIEMLQECGKQIERMDIFIETVRKMSSLDKRELLSKQITATSLQTDIKAELKILGTDKDIMLHVSETKEVFYGDKEVILEVVENLLSNALRYAKEKIDIIVNITSAELRICVKDDGIGFGKNMEKFTQPFYQENVKDSLKHTGLGMYISRLYCEKHGGKLLLESWKQDGASVTAVFGRIV